MAQSAEFVWHNGIGGEMGAHEAGRALSALLRDSRDYRSRWESFALRRGPQVSVAAVCRVVANHLWESGERHEGDDALPRRLRDLVGRALRGEVLTPATLEWLIESFEMQVVDAERLRNLLHSNGVPRSYVGTLTVTDQVGRPGHGTSGETLRTVSLHDHLTVGPARTLLQDEIVEVVEALADGARRHVATMETDRFSLTGLQGVSSVSEPALVAESLYSRTLQLVRPLRQGETATLRYTAAFDQGQEMVNEFRRIAATRLENVDLRIQFDPVAPPANVWFCVWPTWSTRPIETVPVDLEPDGSVHRYLTSVERAFVGFTWSWPLP